MRYVKPEEFRMRCFSCAHNCDLPSDSDVSCCNVCGEACDDGLVISCYDPDDEEYEEVELDDYASNMPCDNTGYCAGASCRKYFECNGYQKEDM